MHILERVEAALSGLGVPFGAGTLVAKSLPDLFLVYSMRNDPGQTADDEEVLRSYLVHVSIFSKDGLLNLPDVDGAMKAVGFKKGAERMEDYSMNDRYFHLIKDFSFLEEV